jgi:hypothetical protein
MMEEARSTLLLPLRAWLAGNRGGLLVFWLVGVCGATFFVRCALPHRFTFWVATRRAHLPLLGAGPAPESKPRG